MKRVAALLAYLLILTCPVMPQDDPQRLPSGKDQKVEIMKAEHEKSLKDLQEILKLAEDLKAEMEKGQGYVLSIGAIKKTEQIEKLAHDIKTRMKRTY